jgi:hypothetical protein
MESKWTLGSNRNPQRVQSLKRAVLFTFHDKVFLILCGASMKRTAKT